MECCSTIREEPFRRWILFTFCFLSVSLVAGVVYGWPALRQQLLDDGSTLDESTLGAVFTVGAWSTQGGRFFSGLARDRFGTRAVTVCCIALTTMGSLGIAWASPSQAGGLGVSLFLMGLGSGVQLCAQPVAGLFPQSSGTMTTFLSGAFQISGLVFPALTIGAARRKETFSAYAAVLFLLGLVSFWLLPAGKSFVQKDMESVDGAPGAYNDDVDKTVEVSPESKGSPEIEEIQDTLETKVESQDEEVAQSDASETQDNPTNVDASMIEKSVSPTALEQLKSGEYILLCSWFSITLVPLQYYVGSIGFQLESMGDDGFYSDLFSIIYAGATVVSPAGGFLADRFSLGVAQGLATALCSGSLLCLALSTSLRVQVVGLVMYGVGRLLIFAMYFANCGKRFSYTNFGTLAGLGLLISALVSLVQYPLISAAADGKAKAVNFGLAALLLAQFPYFVWLDRQEKGSG